MKFFLDTANLDEIRKGADWGIVEGVTTNLSLIAKEGHPIGEQIRRICEIVDGDISAGAMIREGLELSKLHKNVVVKCPLTRDGIKATVPAASLRSPTHIIDCAKAGADIGTMPFKVLDMLFNHPLTDKGLDQFLKDYAKTFQEAPVGR